MLRYAVLVITFALLATTTTGCPWWKDHGPAVKQGVIDCTIAAAKKEAPQFVPAIVAILQGKAPNWQQQLDALVTLGKEATICAIQVVYNEFKTKSTPSTQAIKVSPELVKQMKLDADVAAMAQEYLNAHKWQPK